MLILKWLGVWLIEVLAEALLLGCLLGALVSNQIGLFYGVIGPVLAVPVLLFLNGYYLTRALAGLVWGSQRAWLYPSIASALFVSIVHIDVARSKSALTPEARAAEFPFLAGGACIVFTYAFVGNWSLRKWVQARSKRLSSRV